VVLPLSGHPSPEGRVEFFSESGNHMATFGWPDEDWRWRSTLSARVRQAWILGGVSLGVLVGSVLFVVWFLVMSVLSPL
jgi:hypothetical protein